MSRNAKIFLFVVGGVTLVCIMVCAVAFLLLGPVTRAVSSQFFATDPATVSAGAQEMADYSLPEGYQESAFMNMFFMKMLIISPAGSSEGPLQKPAIMLMQLGENSLGLSQEEIQSQMQQSMKESMGNADYSLSLVDQQKTTIRGQDVTLYVYEGTNSSGEKMREIISSGFTGKSGSLFLMIIGPVENWDLMTINWFIGSIR